LCNRVIRCARWFLLRTVAAHRTAHTQHACKSAACLETRSTLNKSAPANGGHGGISRAVRRDGINGVRGHHQLDPESI